MRRAGLNIPVNIPLLLSPIDLIDIVYLAVLYNMTQMFADHQSHRLCLTSLLQLNIEKVPQ